MLYCVQQLHEEFLDQLKKITCYACFQGVLLEKKRPRIKSSVKPHHTVNVIRIQRTLMHNISTFTTPYATILTCYCVTRVKCDSSVHKMFQAHSQSTIILTKKMAAKLRRFSGSAVFSCSTKLILYGYHFRMDLKIFRALDKGKGKSRDTARALDAEYWQPDSVSTTAKATSSTVSFEIRF